MRRFVFTAFALTVLTACQPATLELTEERKAEIAAEVELLHGQFWDAWRAADVDRGLSFYDNSPELTVLRDVQLIKGFSANRDRLHAGFADISSQTITITESNTTVLAPNVVCIAGTSMISGTDTSGTSWPASPFEFTAIWALRDGEWKIRFAHGSAPTPDTP